ncbi:hypothetical protein [Escherichia coli]|uniref:Uncharacterized protein n=1 Tax=Escherichia coli TaxID=562 RepID=A0A2A2CG76_ECOLX|nr:hypothetical protein [Escherichia coli]MVW44838.1 hypothetical protein [Enterobacteriaceae bacterium TzEc013]EFO1500356.1 hypothetical protein [Escherichia coli]PAU25746.1 hypothetical protein BTQ06_04465 [Escherichia coli]HCL7572500.1 hypothetical protein [Escherichia coli]HDX5578622.1 hypothetical protein [Escherichia coli]
MSNNINGVVEVRDRTDLSRLRPHWPNIAQDLIMCRVPDGKGEGMLMHPETVCANYGMTMDECLSLMSLPQFQLLMRDFKRRIDAMGDSASITLRAQMMTADLMERLYMDVVNGADASQVRERREALRLLAQLGQLDPATNGMNKRRDDGGGAATSVVSVSINMGPGGAVYDVATDVTEVEE